MGKEPSILYFLETEIHSTRKRRTLNSGERACNQLKWVSKFEVWPSPLGICVASRLFCPLHREAFGIKRLSRGGETIVECYILSPYIEKVCGIIVFAKFSCGTSVIVVLNSDIVVYLKMRNFLLLARRFLAWLCPIVRFFIAVLRCSVDPYPLFNLFFFFAHAYTSATRLALIVWYRDQFRF